MSKGMGSGVLAVLVAVLCYSLTGCGGATAPAASSSLPGDSVVMDGWTDVVSAGGLLSKKKPSTLTFQVDGTRLCITAEFDPPQVDRFQASKPEIECSLQVATQTGEPLGEPLPLKFIRQPQENAYWTLFAFLTTSPLKPGKYQLTYSGTGYCNYLVVITK